MRVQRFHPRGCTRPVRATARHEHRLRRRVDLHGPQARVSDRDRADPLVRQARIADARQRGARYARRLGPLPDPVPASRESSTRHRRRVMDGSAVGRLARAALPIIALVSFTLGLAATLAVAGDTLGFDFLAYHQAAARLLAGQPLYDMSYTQTGGFGLFYYPPTFAPILLPLGLLTATTATWSWIAISICAFLVGVAAMPVSRTVKWSTILLAG